MKKALILAMTLWAFSFLFAQEVREITASILDIDFGINHRNLSVIGIWNRLPYSKTPNEIGVIWVETISKTKNVTNQKERTERFLNKDKAWELIVKKMKENWDYYWEVTIKEETQQQKK